mgnify:FL=1
MKQTTIYMKGHTCNNTKYYYCDVSTSTHMCINCEKPFTSELKDGDHIIGRCDDCGKPNTEIIIDTRYKDGTVDGDCLECVSNDKATEQLYNDYRWGYSEEMDMSVELEKIADLPREQLIYFLRSIHCTVER